VVYKITKTLGINMKDITPLKMKNTPEAKAFFCSHKKDFKRSR
jgi:hypothetical protein